MGRNGLDNREWGSEFPASGPALGDADETGRALENERGYLARVARRAWTPNLEPGLEISDLVQITLSKGWQYARAFRGHCRKEWRGWLARILRREVLARSRRGRREWSSLLVSDVAGANSHGGPLSRTLVDPGTSPSAAAGRAERRQALVNALSCLPEEYEKIIRWHHTEGLTFEAVASRLESTPDAVRQKWYRALARLESTLGPRHDPQTRV